MTKQSSSGQSQQSDVGKLWLTDVLRGGMVFNSEVACRLGAVLLEAHYGKDMLDRQLPLTAEDKGDQWRV